MQGYENIYNFSFIVISLMKYETNKIYNYDHFSFGKIVSTGGESTTWAHS